MSHLMDKANKIDCCPIVLGFIFWVEEKKVYWALDAITARRMAALCGRLFQY